MARKDPGAIVSGAGWLASFADKLTEGLRVAGWSNDQIHTLVTEEGAEKIKGIVEAIVVTVTSRPPSYPVITVTGFEEFQLPNWVRGVEKDVIEPVGTLKLEIIEIIEIVGPGEISATRNQTHDRTKTGQTNLGLRHAQVFLTKYHHEGFNSYFGLLRHGNSYKLKQYIFRLLNDL